MTNDTTNGQTSYYAKDPCECGGRIVVTGKKQTCERCSVMTPKKCGECGNEIWWPKDQDDPICEHCDKPATTNSELDLATLEKACKEFGIIWNGNIRYYEDTEDIPVTGSQMRCIAARMVEMYWLVEAYSALLEGIKKDAGIKQKPYGSVSMVLVDELRDHLKQALEVK